MQQFVLSKRVWCDAVSKTSFARKYRQNSGIGSLSGYVSSSFDAATYSGRGCHCTQPCPVNGPIGQSYCERRSNDPHPTWWRMASESRCYEYGSITGIARGEFDLTDIRYGDGTNGVDVSLNAHASCVLGEGTRRDRIILTALERAICCVVYVFVVRTACRIVCLQT